MTLEEFLQVLRCHLAAMEAREWPGTRDRPQEMALLLGADDTRDLIVELTRTLSENMPRAGTAAAPTAVSRAKQSRLPSDAPVPDP